MGLTVGTDCFVVVFNVTLFGGTFLPRSICDNYTVDKVVSLAYFFNIIYIRKDKDV